MNLYKIFIFVLLLSLFSPSQSITRPPHNPFCETLPIDVFCPLGISVDSMPQPLPSDEIEFWFNIAPVFEFLTGDLMADIKLYHSALGFVNRRTGMNWTIEFDGMFESPNATFPYVIQNPLTEIQEVIWCNQGAICVTNGIDWSYYTQKNLLGVISGSQFTQFLNWVPVENNTRSIWYETFNVYHSKFGQKWDPSIEPLIYAYTCDDFAFRAVGLFTKMNITFPSVLPQRDYLNFYVSENPVHVNSTDPGIFGKIIDFYSRYQFKGKDRVTIAELLFEFLFSDKFILSKQEYYYLKLEYPYFNWHFVPGLPLVNDVLN